MKTTKEFFDRLQNDEAFAKEVGAKARAKVEGGESDYKAVWIPIAAEYGYEVKDGELDDMYDQLQGELSEEELGKVSGGTTPLVFASVVFTFGSATYASIKATE